MSELIKEEINTIQQELSLHCAISDIMQFTYQLITKFQNLFVIKRNEILYRDNVCIQLKKGLFQQELIGPQTDKSITDAIMDKLLGKYEIAFPESDQVLFYSILLVTHRVIQNKKTNSFDLYLKMKIPFKPYRNLNIFTIQTPNSFAFPCIEENCFLNS